MIERRGEGFFWEKEQGDVFPELRTRSEFGLLTEALEAWEHQEPPGGREAWGSGTGYRTRDSREPDNPDGEHHTVFSPDHNYRVSWETDRHGEYVSRSLHDTDQTSDRR